MTTTTSLTPDELAQRLEHLRRANEVRTARAKLKKDLKAGRAQLAGVLANPPECVRSAKVIELLLQLPRYGRVRADRVLARCQISSTTRISALDAKTRGELVAALRNCAPSRSATLPVGSSR